MTGIQLPLDYISNNLTEQDDPALWQKVLGVLNLEFLQRYREVNDNKTSWYLHVGACSHWWRPHMSRWISIGRVAFPFGYQDVAGFSKGLPEFDWSVVLTFDGQGWKSVEKFSGKKQIVLRAAIPTYTVRHKQAAIHTVWSRPHRHLLYGFMNLQGQWDCVSVSDEFRGLAAWQRIFPDSGNVQSVST